MVDFKHLAFFSLLAFDFLAGQRHQTQISKNSLSSNSGLIAKVKNSPKMFCKFYVPHFLSTRFVKDYIAAHPFLSYAVKNRWKSNWSAGKHFTKR